MKGLLKSPAFKQTLTFAVLLLGALLASSFLAHTSFAATSLIDPSDNPSSIAGATGGEGDFKTLAQTLLNYFLSFLGFVATIMIIYGGILYVTSAGNDTNVEKAKKILLYAVVGIVLILLSFAIVNTVLGSASGGGNSGGAASSSSSTSI